MWIAFSLLTFIPVILNAARAGRQNLLEFLAALAYAACCVALAAANVLQGSSVSWAQQLSAASGQLLWILAAVWLVVILLFMRRRAHALRLADLEQRYDYDSLDSF